MTNESKSEKFIRLAEKRITKALSELRKVGNLAGPNYEYTQKQIKAIITALDEGVRDISLRFDEPCSAENEDFHFIDWISDSEEPEDDLKEYETIEHTDESR